MGVVGDDNWVEYKEISKVIPKNWNKLIVNKAKCQAETPWQKYF